MLIILDITPLYKTNISLHSVTNHCLPSTPTLEDGPCKGEHPDRQCSKGSHRGYEGHSDGEVQGTPKNVCPHVGAATTRGTASQEQPEPHGRVVRKYSVANDV